jgi:glutamate-1-semialdehyde 2,1-aminomutase
MQLVSPVGSVYQAGTLSGNPIAMAAGIATLEILEEDGAYDRLETQSEKLATGLATAAAKYGVPVAINRVGSMIGLFFVRESGQTVSHFADAAAGDTVKFGRFFNAMLDNGVYLAPSMFEAWFVGLAHDDAAVDQTLAAAERAFETLKDS